MSARRWERQRKQSHGRLCINSGTDHCDVIKSLVSQCCLGNKCHFSAMSQRVPQALSLCAAQKETLIHSWAALPC